MLGWRSVPKDDDTLQFVSTSIDSPEATSTYRETLLVDIAGRWVLGRISSLVSQKKALTVHHRMSL